MQRLTGAIAIIRDEKRGSYRSTNQRGRRHRSERIGFGTRNP